LLLDFLQNVGSKHLSFTSLTPKQRGRHLRPYNIANGAIFKLS
jgi:hypothetical protein